MNKGFVVLHRKITEWEWYSDANTFRVFLHLLLTANHKPSRFRGFEIRRGEIVIGRKSLAKQLKLSEQEIRTAIEHLKSTNEITTKSTNRFTIATLTKYEFYQDKKTKSTNNQPANQPTINQQSTTSKQCNNINNILIPSVEINSTVAKVEKPAAKKVNGWAIWVDINRARNRADPIPTGADTKAAKTLVSHIKDLQTIKDVMGLFLDDDDQYLQRNGHALRLISGRVNAYINQAENLFSVPDDDEALAVIMKIEDEVAAEEQAKREKQSGNTNRPASAN